MRIDVRAPARMVVRRLQLAWRTIRARSPGRQTRADVARFRLMYERFREILNCNDATLQLIADIEDRLSGRTLIPLDLVARRTREAAMDVFVMVKNLNQISGNAHTQLYPALLAIGAELDAACPPPRPTADDWLVLPLDHLRQRDAVRAGTKMARLGEIRAQTGLIVPDGFVVTTAAFSAFLTENELWERAARLDDVFERHGNNAALAAACREVESAIRSGVVPEAVASAMLEACDRLAGGREVRLAVRSSAVGEDTHASHAGQYHTELNVDRRQLTTAYRTVIASAYSPAAVSYRFERGITASEAAMAVGCIRMAQPRCSGIVFSRRPESPAGDDILVSAVPGSLAALASGERGAEVWMACHSREVPDNALLSAADVGELVAAARVLEQLFARPQEIEWAFDPEGLCILQSRPMAAAPEAPEDLGPPLTEETPLMAGGYTACPGIGAGPVVRVCRDEDLDTFPDGGVLVARHSSPLYSRVLSRCAAVVTDIGSPAGHMAILAREYAVPAIVGTGQATSLLQPGLPVTVDATRREVFAGVLPHSRRPRTPIPTDDTPAMLTLRRIARVVTPLSLTDPGAPDFTPAACRSLHDLTRYVHEKTFEVMFRCGDAASTDMRARVLAERLPFTVHVFDVGGGLRDEPASADALRQPEPGHSASQDASHDVVRVDDIACAPLRAFLAGLMDTRVRWDRPRPVSARGFLAVLGERMAGMPGEALDVGGASYAIIADRYMNFSTKAGYHFSTIDTYCGRSLNKNYIHFRFTGGAADEARRLRRIRFVQNVLVALDFRVQTRSDLLVARLDKFDREAIISRLTVLGRLTICCRQLDMLMDAETSPDFFSRAFLADDMGRF
jgi:pyruvate,water dikinase